MSEAYTLMHVPVRLVETVQGIANGSLVAVLAEMDDCAPLREAIDDAYSDGEGYLTGAALYALWRKLVAEYAAAKDARHD